MPAHRSFTRPSARGCARVVLPVAIAALTGCVDTGVRLFEIDAAGPPDAPDMLCVELADCDGDADPIIDEQTPDADMLPSGRFDADLDAARPDRGRPDLALDGALDGALDMRPQPDMDPRPDLRPPPDMRPADLGPPDQGPLGPPCSLGCDGAETLAAYVPLDRLDLVHRLDDGALLIGGTTRDDADIRRLGGNPEDRVGVVGQLPIHPMSTARVVLLHVDEALETVTQVYAFGDSELGPPNRATVRDGHLYLSTRYAMSEMQADALVRPRLGYVVARFEGVPTPEEQPMVQALWLLGATGEARVDPAWDAIDPAAVFAADDNATRPGGGRLHIVAPNGSEQIMPGWRFHSRAAGVPGDRTTLVYGPSDENGIRGSFVPLTPDLCPLRTWYAPDEVGGGEDLSPSEDFQRESTEDGNGEDRPGTEPHDAFGSRPCLAPTDESGPRPADALVTLNGWRLDAGQRFDVIAALRADDGALYVALNATASTREADDGINDDHVPTVLRFDAEGRLQWWQRLHGQRDGGWKNSSVDQRIVDMVLAPGGEGVIVLARSLVRPETLDEPQLWTRDGAFQQPPVGGDGVPVGWLGLLDADDGALARSTYVFDPIRDTPERLGAPLDCWPDSYDLAAAAFEPARGGLAVSDSGVVAVHGITHRARTTPDALVPTGRDVPPTPMPVVRVFDADLQDVLHSSVIVGDLDAPDPSAELAIRDIAFDARGRVIVVGEQTTGAAPLPARRVPAWGARNPATAQSVAERATTAFIVRLDLDPECRRGNDRDALD